MTILIALILMITIAIPLFALPTANAGGTMETYAFIGATPNPVGVGQELLLHIGITQQLTNVAMGWEGLSVTITKPDGTTETISDIKTDSTGGTGRIFTPSMVGNYTFQTHFPAQNTTVTKVAGSTPVGTYMLASDSDKQTIIVNDSPLRFNPGIPLPTEYWSRPINAQFREWYSIAGSSWESNEYNAGPDTPHILWSKPLTIGGLVGGQLGLVGSGATSVAFSNGDAYQGLWSSRFIIAGILIYNWHTGARPLEYTAVDLRTGEELWTKTFLDNRTISTAQLFYWQSYNSQGSWPYLWVVNDTTWYAFSPYDAALRFIIWNVPSGTNVIGPRGEIYRYTVNQNAGYMTLWNMSALISNAGGFGSNNYPGPSIFTTYNASATQANGTLTTAAARAWAYNITIPKGLPGSVRAIDWTNGRVVGSSLNNTDVVTWSFAIPPTGTEGPIPNPTPAGSPGTLLYNYDWKAPADWAAGNQTLSWGTTSLAENVATVWSKEERRHYGFSLETGQYLWKTEAEHYVNIYSAGRTIAYGNLYSIGQSGILYTYNLTTGKIMWTYEPNDVYREVLWSDNWPMNLDFVSGGKLYLFHSEHSANQPLPRLSPFVCLNATTGEVIFRVDGLLRNNDWGGDPIMGDSVIAMYNAYDQQVYAVGKGPSATTVIASPKVSVHGSSVLVEGTVTDVSPGTTQTSLKLRFPYGIPAVSDDSQGEWMKYVYNQFPRPTNAAGVPVILTVLDANNNSYDIGVTTTDASGTFGYSWKPEISGQYTIYATFAGSGAYYPSYAQTYVNVEQPSEPTPTSLPLQQTSIADTYFIPAVAAIILAIAIGFAITILVLRKRP